MGIQKILQSLVLVSKIAQFKSYAAGLDGKFIEHVHVSSVKSLAQTTCMGRGVDRGPFVRLWDACCNVV